MAKYFNDAFHLLEKAVDDPTLTIDDIGVRIVDLPMTLVDDDPYKHTPEEPGVDIQQPAELEKAGLRGYPNSLTGRSFIVLTCF